MKISFFFKILVLLIFLTIIPLITLRIFVMNDIENMEKVSIENMEKGTKILINDSKYALTDLGEIIIKEKARNVAKQVEVYIRSKSNTSIKDLQNDEYMQNIALTSVGKTGYTCLYECKTGIMRIHPNSVLIDKNMIFLKNKLKDWWLIFEKSLNCIEVSGYYNWKEKNGKTRKKYMTMSPVNGTFYMVAATTYIDEFSIPVKDLELQMQNTETVMSKDIRKTAKVIKYRSFYIIFIMLFVIFIVGAFFAFSITKPIKKLKKLSKKISEGTFDEKIEINSNDEFSELSHSFNNMAKKLEDSSKKLDNYNKELEKTVQKRTRELKKKNDDLEKFNKFAINRELKMIELKKKLKNKKK
jgi:nitrogen fixation/metabolism regulation signal transduction histidine kinase